MERFKKFLKAAAFVLAFVLLFNVVSSALVSSNVYRHWQWVGGFYENEKDSLDAVYIGSSATYAFWCPSLGWEQNGIAVWNYTTGQQTILPAKYIIEECRKTQKDALYIVNLNRASSEYNLASIHYLLDYMPFSFTKLKLTKALCDGLEVEKKDRLQYYVPLELYHSRWDSLTLEDFSYRPDGTMGSSSYASFLSLSLGSSNNGINIDYPVKPVDGEYVEILTDLLDYCEGNGVKVLFTINPQLSEVSDRYGEMLYLKELIEKRGFDVADFWTDYEKIGLEIPKDFYNDRHTNIHGSIKMTEALSKYLIENYGFEDKRKKEGYEDWDKAFEIYYNNAIGSKIVPVELETENRDYSLCAVGVEGSYDGEKINVSFSSSEGADGYKVYRKTINNHKKTQSVFRELFTLENGETSFSDSDFSAENNGLYSFAYIIVPFKTVDGTEKYGSFDYLGLTVKVE